MSAPKPAAHLLAMLAVASAALGDALYLIEQNPNLASALRSSDVVFHVREALDHLLDAQGALLPPK